MIFRRKRRRKGRLIWDKDVKVETEKCIILYFSVSYLNKEKRQELNPIIRIGQRCCIHNFLKDQSISKLHIQEIHAQRWGNVNEYGLLQALREKKWLQCVNPLYSSDCTLSSLTSLFLQAPPLIHYNNPRMLKGRRKGYSAVLGFTHVRDALNIKLII